MTPERALTEIYRLVRRLERAESDHTILSELASPPEEGVGVMPPLISFKRAARGSKDSSMSGVVTIEIDLAKIDSESWRGMFDAATDQVKHTFAKVLSELAEVSAIAAEIYRPYLEDEKESDDDTE